MNQPERYPGDEVSDKSRLVTLILAVILGVFGGHRFYTGKIQSGILMACTLGGLGLWALYDIIMIAAGAFRDEQGRLVHDWEVTPDRQLGHSADVQEEIAALRQEVSDLAERVDFAERLLADPERTAVRRPSGPK
ncbi:MAG: NINE protein [Gemmatimonadota bacterium]